MAEVGMGGFGNAQRQVPKAFLLQPGGGGERCRKDLLGLQFEPHFLQATDEGCPRYPRRVGAEPQGQTATPQRLHGIGRSWDQPVADEDRPVQVEQNAFDVFERLRHSTSRIGGAPGNEPPGPPSPIP